MNESTTAGSGPGSGPFVKAAFFCERVLTEKDDVLTPIRIVDRFTLRATGPNPPDEMAGVPLALTTVIMLIAGSARGRKSLDIQMQHPDGLRQETGKKTLPIIFEEAENKGTTVTFVQRFTATQEGTYWFDVSVDGHLLTRMPLLIRYVPLRTS